MSSGRLRHRDADRSQDCAFDLGDPRPRKRRTKCVALDVDLAQGRPLA
jgi:hypothetical protein